MYMAVCSTCGYLTGTQGYEHRFNARVSIRVWVRVWVGVRGRGRGMFWFKGRGTVRAAGRDLLSDAAEVRLQDIAQHAQLPKGKLQGQGGAVGVGVGGDCVGRGRA